jgi:predicted secreted Zn-dependent protease
MILKSFRAICVAALLMLAIRPAIAQPFRHLTTADFMGAPKPNGRGVIAYTNCTIDFNYQANHSNNNYILHFKVTLQMNNYKSWMDKARITSADQLAAILKHEQGHYNIAYLEQQEVMRTMEHTRFTANYRTEAMNLFDRIDAKYKQLNIDYDEDTQHSVNKQQQHSWDIYFAKRLEYMPPTENASM